MKGYFVYCLCDENYIVVYVGSSSNLKTRIDRHIADNKEFRRVFYLEYDSEEAMLQKEKSFVSKFKPKYNKTLYSGVQPNDDVVTWVELDSSLFIDKVTYRVNNKTKTDSTFYKIHSSVLWLRFLISKSVMVGNEPVRVEFTAADKLIYCYIKQRFDLCNQIGVEYTETRAEIAEALGLNSKTVDRFISKMSKHGFIDYKINKMGNNAVYLNVLDIAENNP